MAETTALTATTPPAGPALAHEELDCLAPLYPLPRLALVSGRGATVRDAAGVIASERKTFYQTFPWGEERVKEVLDPSGAALTSWWSYQTNSRDPAYGQLITSWRPDGSTEDFWYDSNRRQWAHLSPAWFIERFNVALRHAAASADRSLSEKDSTTISPGDCARSMAW